MVTERPKDLGIYIHRLFVSYQLLDTGESGVIHLPILLRKEVIHPHLPVRIPCYDLVLIANLAVVGPL